MNARLLSILLTTAMAWPMAAGAAVAEERTFFPQAAAIGDRRTLPSLPLIGTDGAPFSLEAYRGKWVWLYMGFTSCPGVCPFALDAMTAELGRLADPTLVQGVFLSLDPARDDPQTVGAYAKAHHPTLVGATGPHAELERLVRSLGTSYEVLPPQTPGGYYAVAHPNLIFVIDPKGRLAATYEPRYNSPPGFLADDFNQQEALSAAEAAAGTGPTTAPTASTGTAWCGEAPEGTDGLMQRARTLGSGTSVLPAASPMRMWSHRADEWLWMLHGSAVLGANHQAGPRGATTWAAENWAMLMGSRFLGPGILDLRAMGSLEPWTLPPGGTPQLFQTGETYLGQALVDRQHPHDLFMEMAGRYTWNMDGRTALFAYGGPVGEPALGPSAFMHRPSAADNHWAPLGHHHQDASHIAYGVATVGLRRDDVQLEASAFNGREPDETRWNMEIGPLDSLAGRLSYFPGRNWALQASFGHLKEPEVLHPGDVRRATASATHVLEAPWGTWSVMSLWGMNVEPDLTQPLHSVGLESQLDLLAGHHLYGRYELVDKAGLPPGPRLNHDVQRIQALTLGYVLDLPFSPLVDWGLGADATVYGAPATAAGAYGPSPFAARVYLRWRPPTMRHLSVP